ncbi:MAG TPA: hypothetical protein VF707_15480 [Ardenticatenaceae bacterium]|jgi:hypothetical protein
MPSNGTVRIELTRAEALVLFEFLYVTNEQNRFQFADKAEQFVIWYVIARLEKELDELFDPKFYELLERARDEVRDEKG